MRYKPSHIRSEDDRKRLTLSKLLHRLRTDPLHEKLLAEHELLVGEALASNLLPASPNYSTVQYTARRKDGTIMKLLEQIGEVHPGQTAFTWFMFSLWLLHSTRVTTCPFTNMSRFLTVPLPEVPMSGEGVVAIHVSRDYARTGPNRWRTGAFPKRRAEQPRKARVLLQRLIGSNLLLDVGQVLMSDTVRANKISQQRSVCCARAALH